jgi:hypothetical protein
VRRRRLTDTATGDDERPLEESLAWRDYFVFLKLVSTSKTAYDYSGDDYVASSRAAHPSVFVRAYAASETAGSSLGGGYEVAFNMWENAITVYGDACGQPDVTYGRRATATRAVFLSPMPVEDHRDATR